MNKQKFQELSKSVTEDEFKDFVGIKAYNFLKAKNKLEEGKSSDDFSVLAMFLNVFYGSYYKYWSPMISFAIGALIIDIISDTPEKLQGYSGLLGIFLAIYWGLYFKSGYVKHAYKKIAKLKQIENDPERLKTLLSKKGGTSILHAFIALIVFFILTLLLSAG